MCLVSQAMGLFVQDLVLAKTHICVVQLPITADPLHRGIVMEVRTYQDGIMFYSFMIISSHIDSTASIIQLVSIVTLSCSP